MTRITVSIEIPHDVATVWADVSQLESHVEWMADADSIEFVDGRTRGVGVVMNVLTRVGPLHTTDVIRVTSWVPERSIGVTHEGLVTGTGEFRLETTSVGTRFTWDESLRMPWYFGGPVGAVLARPILGWVWRRNLQTLAERFA